MKRFLSLCMALALFTVMWAPALAANSEEPAAVQSQNVDYMSLMLQAASEGSEASLAQGAEYEAKRNEKITSMNLPYETTSFFSASKSADQIEAEILEYLGRKSQAEEDDEDVYYAVDASALNVRKTPGTSGAIVGKFYRGAVLTYLNQSSGGWLYVTDGKLTGWCSAEFLQKTTSSAAGSTSGSYTQDDLYYLAVAIYREAGSSWLSDTHQLLVGNVVLNRVASSRFPNTIYDVLHQKGQYPWAAKHNYGEPSARCYENAKRLLEGERFCPANVVFQAQFKQGSGVYTKIYDKTLGSTTYFCYQ